MTVIELTALIEVPCLNCGKPVAAAVTGRDECIELDEKSLVVYNRTFPDSTGFVGICSSCLSQLSIPRYISGIAYYSCGGKVNGQHCPNTILCLVSAFGDQKVFGGRAVFEPKSERWLYDVSETKCNSCLKALRPLAQLKRFVQQFISALHEPTV
ncbi:MAG: hypothetical protein KJI72_00635 [Patescibacteria group bacterium]|nr:hypothetical protein [Patescibacteria group bacterium]